jgi:hypothetical protein
MTNRFGVDLYPKEVRWAAAEGVSEDVIAAVLLLHERSVEEIVPQLSPLELEKVIVLVGRSPRLYPRGILEALDRHKNSLAPAPITQSVPPNAAAVVSHNAAKPACQPEIRTKSDADQMRQAHERRLAVLRAHPPESPAEPANRALLRPARVPGFTESADAEDVMALLRDNHAAIGEIIIKYNGTLERYAGDGVMVVFNDPVPVENPALQAVLMALEVREAIGALTATWSRLGHEIGFGIGIAHGLAAQSIRSGGSRHSWPPANT